MVGNMAYMRLIKAEGWKKKTSYSLKDLRTLYECAEIDEELFELMKSEVTRVPLNSYLVSMI